MVANLVNKAGLRIIILWLPVLLCMGAIFYTSSIPAGDIPPLFAYQDIIYHFFIYLLLALFFIRAVKNTSLNITAAKALLFTVIFCVIYGITDEWHQAFVLGRDPSSFDVFIDGIGSVIGSSFYRIRISM